MAPTSSRGGLIIGTQYWLLLGAGQEPANGAESDLPGKAAVELLQKNRPRRGSARQQRVCDYVEIDNLLVRIHSSIVMIRWTGLAPWEFEFPFPGSLISTFLEVAVELLQVQRPQRGSEGQQRLCTYVDGVSTEESCTVRYSSRFKNSFFTEL